MDTELSEKSVDMRLYRALCNEELASDLGIGKPFAHEGIDLSLARRKSRHGVNDGRHG